MWLVTDGAFKPVAVVLACSDRALLRIAGGFGAAVTPLLLALTVSLGVLVQGGAVALELMSFAALWLPTGRVLLLGRSSGLVPVGAGAPGDAKREALVVAPLFSLLPRDEELRLVGNPLTGSFDAVGAAGRPTDPDGGCWLAVDLELDVAGARAANADARSAAVRGLGIPWL